MNEVFKKEWELYRAAGSRPQFRRLEKRVWPKGFDAPVQVGEIRIFADMNRPFVALVLESRGAVGYRLVPVSPFTVPASAREMLVGERVFQLWNACTAAKEFTERSWLVATLEAADLAEIAAAVAAVPSGARSEDETAKSGELMTVKMRYKKPDGDKSILIEKAHTAAEMTRKEPSADFRFASAVAEFALILENSKHKGDVSFGKLIERARTAKGEDREGYRAEFIRLAEAAEVYAPAASNHP